MESNLRHIPLEVIENILSNLGVSDLLNCRLVDLDWNQECLKQLRKSEGRKYVNDDNIGSVLEFVTNSANSNSEPWVLPFELIITLSEDDNDDCSSELEKLSQVSSLLEHAPGSVFDMILDCYCRRRKGTFRSLVKILSKCSPHLKGLDISFIEGSTAPISKKSAVNILRHENLMFPNLKKLDIGCSWEETENLAKETFGNTLIQRSPNLEELKIFTPEYFDQNNWPLPVLHKLKELQVRQGRTDSFNLLTSVPAPHLIPNLESLHLVPNLSQVEAEQQTQTLRTIVLSFSATLKFLAIDEFPPRQNLAGDTVVTVTPIKFPALPRLEHLRLGLEYYADVPIYANLEEFHLSLPNFPALKSVDIELGFYWGMAPSASGEATLPLQTFNTVERLRLWLQHFPQYIVEEYMAHVQSVFPNVTHLALTNRGILNLRPVLKGVFGSARAPRIRTFELITPARNALSGGQGGDHFVLPINNMQNVTNFRVRSMDSYIDESDLRWFTAQFPALTLIEILAPSWWTWSQNQRVLCQVMDKFPACTIKVTRED